MVDGSIQGFTARLRWPGYHNGAPNGIWVTAPGELDGLVQAYHEAAQLHIHTNGDEATQVAIEVARALARHPRPDHRHTLQHCQMADAAQFRAWPAWGCAPICSPTTSTTGAMRTTRRPWGRTGPSAWTPAPRRRARRALRHPPDAPITPLGPLFTAWCAATRTTSRAGCWASPSASVDEALRAITLGAAYTLHMDHLVGSIEVGKHADFCVLEDDPGRPAERLKDAGCGAPSSADGRWPPDA